MKGKKILLNLDRLAEAIGAIKRTGFKITQKAVARRLHVDEYWFSVALKDKELRERYEALVSDST